MLPGSVGICYRISFILGQSLRHFGVVGIVSRMRSRCLAGCERRDKEERELHRRCSWCSESSAQTVMSHSDVILSGCTTSRGVDR